MGIFRSGRLTIGVEGPGSEIAYLRSELAVLPAASGGVANVTLSSRGRRDRSNAATFAEASPVRVGDSWYEVTSGRLRYSVDVGRSENESAFSVGIDRPNFEETSSGLRPLVTRFRSWNYLSPEEVFGTGLMYDLFDYLTQIAQLPLGQSYVHASAIEKDGNTLLLPAWGGVGKSTSMLKLVLEHGWRYLGDDLSTIDVDGTVYRHPKRMQIYGYNVAGQPHLEHALLDSRDRVDRASWEYHLRRHGPKRVRRRVSAEDLFAPTQIAPSARLTHVRMLQRTSSPDFGVAALTEDELVDRAVWTVMNELEPFSVISEAMRAVGKSILPTPSELADETRKVLGDALAGKECLVVSIPQGASPSALVEFLLSTLD